LQRVRSVSALAAGALGLAEPNAAPDLARSFVLSALDRSERFEDRYRLVMAAKALAPHPDAAEEGTGSEAGHDARIDRWLDEIVHTDQPWMLKVAAIEALAARGAKQSLAAADHALRDAYPRVRSAAARVLGEDSYLALARLARQDDWPLVREAAVTAVATHQEAKPVLLAGLGDPAPSVRTAALKALTHRREPAAAPRVLAMIESEREWPTVIEAAIAYVEALCLPEARASLLKAFQRGMAENPWPPDVQQAAAALRVLASLGGPEAEKALKAASLPSAPGPLQVTAEHARSEVGVRCGQSPPQQTLPTPPPM
jgi:HEAT repeat protein